MKRSSCLLRLISSLALLSFSVSGLFGQSIADAARKERARREQSGSDAKVLTEEDLRAISPEARRSGRQESSLATEPQDGKGGEHSVPFSLRGQSMIDRWIVQRLWSHQHKHWRCCGWKTLPRSKLYGEYGLVNLIALIPSMASQKKESS